MGELLAFPVSRVRRDGLEAGNPPSRPRPRHVGPAQDPTRLSSASAGTGLGTGGADTHSIHVISTRETKAMRLKVRPHVCPLCGVAVYQWWGQAFDFDGVLHAYECRPERGSA